METYTNKSVAEKSIIGFVGGGNMAKAIAFGLMKKGLLSNSQIIVSCPSESGLADWKQFSVKTAHSNSEVIHNSDIIFITMKPHQFNPAFQNINLGEGNLKPSKLFISILAGISCQEVYDIVQKCGLAPRVIRVMPNTAAAVNESCSAVCGHASATETDLKTVVTMFRGLGRCEIVPENLMTAVTGLAGSGPAYAFMMIEALADGGVKQGLPRNIALTFAAQTLFGAAKMVLQQGKHPGQLKDEVCSASGTTIHALHTLEKAGFRGILMSAVESATQRSEELLRDYLARKTHKT